MKSVVVEAFEISEAVESGARELGVSIDDVEFEIVSAARSAWFGLKRVPARVRVSLCENEEIAPKMPSVRSPYTGAEVVRDKSKKPLVDRRRRSGSVSAAYTGVERRHTQEAGYVLADESTLPEQAEPVAARAEPTAKKAWSEVSAQGAAASSEQSEDIIRRTNETIEYLSTVVKLMKVEDLTLGIEYIRGKKVGLSFNGKNASQIIGHRGETLDALQLIASVRINNYPGEFIKLDINSDNYRQQRESSLKSLAQRLSRQALRTGKVIKLEPMNSYERRIIHSVISDIVGVSSVSEGEAWARHIIIIPEKKPVPDTGRTPKPPKKNFNYRGSRSVATRIDDSEFFADASLGVPLVSGEARDTKQSEPVKPATKTAGSSELYTKISVNDMGGVQ